MLNYLCVTLLAKKRDLGTENNNRDNFIYLSIYFYLKYFYLAREEAPKDLAVEPINQTSVEVRWKPPLIGVQEDDPIISYEIYYVPADKQIEEDEFESLPKW